MTARLAALAVLVSVPALLGACATRSVTLLPGEPGQPVGAVAVIDEAGNDRGVIDTANARAPLRRGGAVRGAPVAEGEVAKRYGALVADLPSPPETFTFHFETGYARLMAEDEATLQAMLAAATARPGAEVQVVGHTDTLDTDDMNDRISQRRAEEVRDYLVSRGLKPEQVRATWRGEREPLVDKGDGVAEAANRRVEVIVR